MVPATDRSAELLDLALLQHRLNGLDLDLEHQFDGSLDFRLGRIAKYLEKYLVVLFGCQRDDTRTG